MATILTGAYNKLAGVLAFKLAQNLPVLLNTEQQVSKEVFESGKAANGLTMNYVLPDYGEVLEGPTIDESKMNYSAGVVPVSLRQFNIPFSAGSYTMSNGGNAPTWPVYQEDTTAIGGTTMTRNMLLDFEKQVKFPYGANLASKMQKRTIRAGHLGCGTTILLDAARQAAGDTLWDAFSEAASAIRNARSDDDIFGVISPRMAAKAARGAANLFHPGDRISKLWTKCELGEFATAKWFETADVEYFTTDATCELLIGNTTPTINTGVALNEGDDEIQLSAAITANIPAGTPFLLQDANGNYITQVDPLGSETGVPFTFVVQEDLDASATPAPDTLKVQKLYTKGALKNVNVLPDDTFTIVPLLKTNTNYAYGLVWSKAGLATAWGQMDNLEGANNFTFGPSKGLLFYGASMADIVHRRNIWRLDCLKGEVVTMSNWVASILVEL